MKIIKTKHFEKAFNKCPKRIQVKVLNRLNLLLNQPSSPLLNIHELKGVLRGVKSLNVTGDYRILYSESKSQNEIILLLLNIGTHSQLYK